MMSRVRLAWALAGCLALSAPAAACLVLAAPAAAQPPQPGNPPQSGIVYQGPNVWVEAFFVLVPCAAVLYAVCRSSRRN